MLRKYCLLFIDCCHEYCYSLNRLVELARGFGTAPSLAILNLTYNFSDDSFPGSFSYLGGWYNCIPGECHLCGFRYFKSAVLG